MKRALWSRLLDEDPDLRRWYDNLARGSEGTAVERVRVLGRFLAFQNLTPKGLADLAKSDRKRVEDMLSDFVGSLLKMGRSPGYAGNYVKAVRSWLDHNDIRLMRRIRIEAPLHR